MIRRVARLTATEKSSIENRMAEISLMGRQKAKKCPDQFNGTTKGQEMSRLSEKVRFNLLNVASVNMSSAGIVCRSGNDLSLEAVLIIDVQ